MSNSYQLTTVAGVPVAAFPGASMMRVSVVTDGVEVTCPECRASQIVSLPEEGFIASFDFRHANGCSIDQRIVATTGVN